MQLVQPGDAVLMFAKGVGIIGIGRATGHYERLQPEDAGRVYKEDSVEWRVPVDWLDWRDQEDAFPFVEAPNATFINVSDVGYTALRERVKEHFVFVE